MMKIKDNVSEIKRLYQKRKEMHEALFRFLAAKGLSPLLVQDLLRELPPDAHPLPGIKNLLAQKLKTTEALTFDTPRTLILVGPTGVGKTTTLLKLGTFYQNQGIKVSLHTIDEGKKGEIEKLAAEAKLKRFEESSPYDLLLVDTAGCNFYEPGRIDELGERLACFSEESEITLTLSAAAKEVDLCGAIHQFSPLCPKSALFTKFDETLTAATLVNVMMKTELPLRYVTYGYPLPGEIQLADSEAIAHKILTDFNQEEFQMLRQFTNDFK